MIDPKQREGPCRDRDRPFQAARLPGPRSDADDAVWTCPRGGTLVRIDPSGDAVPPKSRSTSSLDQASLVKPGWSDLGPDQGGSRADRDSTNAPVTRSPSRSRLPETCNDLAVSSDSIWVTCYVADKVLQVDPQRGRGRCRARTRRACAYRRGRRLWVGFGRRRADRPGLARGANRYEAYPGVTDRSSPGWLGVGPCGRRAVPDPVDRTPGKCEVIERRAPSGGDVVRSATRSGRPPTTTLPWGSSSGAR